METTRRRQRRIINLIRYIPELTLTFLFLMTSMPALHAEQKATVIMSGNTRNMFPVLALDPDVSDAEIEFEKALMKEKKKNRDAYLIDTGNSISLGISMETAYTYPSAAFFDELEYDAVNLTAKDALLSTTISTGYQVAPQEYTDRLISGFIPKSAQRKKFPSSKRLEKEGNTALTLVNFPSTRPVSGMSSLLQLQEPSPDSKTLEVLKEARERGDIVVGLSSLIEERLKERMAQANSYPHYLIDQTIQNQDPVKHSDGYWLLSSPASGEILTVQLELDENGQPLEPKVSDRVYMTEEEYASLMEFPVPKIGVQVPNLDSILNAYFDVERDAARIDRVDLQEMGALTQVEKGYVYHLKTAEEDIRIYRVKSEIPDKRYDMVRNTGWPHFDILVILDTDSNFLRVENRTGFPVATVETTLAQSLNRLANVPVSQWTPDPFLAAGIEDAWEWATDALKKTIELDRKLYGPDGIYQSSQTFAESSNSPK